MNTNILAAAHHSPRMLSGLLMAILLILGLSARPLAAQKGTVTVFAGLGQGSVLGGGSDWTDWSGGMLLGAGVEYGLLGNLAIGGIVQRSSFVMTYGWRDDYVTTGVGPRCRYTLVHAGKGDLYGAGDLMLCFVQSVSRQYSWSADERELIPSTYHPTSTVNVAADLAIGAAYRINPTFSVAAECGYVLTDVGNGVVHSLPIRLRVLMRL